MSEISLYNKWRPNRFDEFVGQETPVKILKSMLINNRIHNAYLLYGNHGSGKTTLARVFARAVNCQHPNPHVRPCGQCPYCLSQNMDIVEIDAATSTGIDDVRSLRERIKYLPELGQKRIYIIDEIHRFSGAAFDAMLKIIEEPPAHIIFMMATTELEKIPDTIKSRCVLVPFRAMAINDIEEHLAHIAQVEGISIDRAGIHIIALESKGSMRDAIKLMDQASVDPNAKVRVEDIQELTGIIQKDYVKNILKAITVGAGMAIIQTIQQALDAGAVPAKLAYQIAEAAHSKLIYSIDNNLNSEYEILSDISSNFMELTRNTGSIERIDLEILSLKLAGKQRNYFTLDMFANQWTNGQMENTMARYTKFARSIIQNCTPIEYNNGVLTLQFYSPELADSMRSGNKVSVIETALKDLNLISIKVIVAG